MADDVEEVGKPKGAGGKKSLPAQLRSAANDVRKDTIVTSANLYLVARRILLTSLGAVALTIEETNEFIEKLVERGELAEHELSHLVEDLTQRKRTEAALPDKSNVDDGSSNVANSLSVIDALALDGVVELPATTRSAREEGRHVAFPVSALADQVEVILDRLNVPTRSDIEALSAKIGRLSDKVAQLKSRGDAPQDAAPTNGIHDELLEIVARNEEKTPKRN